MDCVGRWSSDGGRQDRERERDGGRDTNSLSDLLSGSITFGELLSTPVWQLYRRGWRKQREKVGGESKKKGWWKSLSISVLSFFSDEVGGTEDVKLERREHGWRLERSWDCGVRSYRFKKTHTHTHHHAEVPFFTEPQGHRVSIQKLTTLRQMGFGMFNQRYCQIPVVKCCRVISVCSEPELCYLGPLTVP